PEGVDVVIHQLRPERVLGAQLEGWRKVALPFPGFTPGPGRPGQIAARRDPLPAGKEVDLVRRCHDLAPDELLTEAAQGQPEHRPSERQLRDLLLADEGELLRNRE